MISVDSILSDSHDLSKLEDLCRLCGKTQPTIVPIFDETHRYNYYKIILLHFKDEIQVSKADILPLKMCSKCLKSMMSWHEFYLDCLKVDKKFKRLMDKFSLNCDSEKPTSTAGNVVEVIEVSVDCDSDDYYNENTNEYDISNINIKESTTSVVNTDDFPDFHDVEDSNDSDAENKIVDKSINHSEPAGGDQTASLPIQQKPKKKKSTVCRICGKLYTNRGTYLNHLRKAHSTHRTAKVVAKKPLSQQQLDQIEKDKQEELKQLQLQYLQKKMRKKPPPRPANTVPDICYKCGKTFKHPSSLRNHLKYTHPADPEAAKQPLRAPRMCELCGKLCKSNYFRKHMLKHTNPDSVKCKDCDKVFAYESTLKSHIRVCHNDDKPFACTICSSAFKRADYLRTHIRYRHQDVKLDDMFKCDQCDMIYKTKKYYDIHLKTHEEGFVNSDKPKAPRRKTESDGTVKFVCKICNQSFKKRNYLQLHERYVHVQGQPYSISENAEGQYKCDQCDRRFTSMTGRNYHCKSVHGKEFDMNFSAKCDHCGLTFSNRVFYARHKAKLNGMPTCYLCWKQFNSDEELTKHIDLDHFTDLPFVCELCKCRFVALKNLDHHIRTRHFNDKPFKCDICDHRTTRKDALRIHIRGTHLGEKPYECGVCGKRFSQRNDWRKHEAKHDKWSKTTKIEDPKKKDTNKSQLLALGKRSTASKGDHDESCSSPAKRTRSNTKAGNIGGSDGVGTTRTPKQSIPLKKTAVNKVKNTTIAKPTGKAVEKTEKTKPSNISIKPPALASNQPTAPVEIFLDEDSDIEFYETEFKLEQANQESQKDEVDEINLECDLESDPPSPESNDAKKDPNASGTSIGKKRFIRPPKMCDVCGKVVSAKLFKEHMVMHNDPESMTCSCCGELFSTVSTLKKHFIWTHTSLRPFMCDLCGSTFKRNDHLKLHRAHFHANENNGGTAVKCGVCGASVQTLVSLQSHMKRVHNEKKIVSYDKDLNHKILADKSYECGICGLNFKQFSYLRIHIKFVHEKGLPWHINQGASGPYKCEPCNSTYATLQSLREHNRRRHDGAPVEKFHKECTHCGMLYRNRLHYSKHLAKISGRPTCYVCWNDFDDADDLKAHINSDHLDELPFGCELCGVRFVYLTELRNHMYTHSKNKQFKCDECGQSFVRKDFLKSHKRRHQGIRNHTCEECSKSFVEFCDLRKHMQIHMRNKLFTVKDDKSITPSHVISHVETTVV